MIQLGFAEKEYALILSKAKQVEEIKAKKEREQQEERNRASRGASRSITKKRIPVFEMPKEEQSDSKNDKQEDTGKSMIAFILRIVACITGIFTVIYGAVAAFNADTFLLLLFAVGVGALEMLICYALAAILDYLAELTSIAENGFKYHESYK